MKTQPPPASDTNRPLNWRDLKQGQTRVRSDGLRRRQVQALVRRWAVVAGVLFVISALGLILYFTRSGPTPVRVTTVEGPRLERVTFASDGVLRASWAAKVLDLQKGQELFKLDLALLQAQLEAHGQVRAARVSIELPGTLQIHISERTPLLRARLRHEGRDEVWLIARDGVVYRGEGYLPENLRQLPPLAGVRLRPEGSGYRPLVGMEDLAPLIDMAREQYPEIFADWAWISLAHFDGHNDRPGSRIEIGGRYVRSAIFAPRNFPEQLLKLKRVRDEHLRRQVAQVQRVDLTVPGDAIVLR